MARLGLAGRLADRLIDSALVPLLLAASLIFGAAGLLLTPQQDRPDVEVPTAQVVVPFPGGGAERVDELVARPVAAWAGQLEHVVEVRSVASADATLLEVEFATGVSDAQAYGELKELFDSHRHRLPRGVGAETIRTLGDDLLTSLMVTMYSEKLDGFELRRIAIELASRVGAIEGVRDVIVHGGESRQVRVLPRPADLAAHGVDFSQLVDAIEGASVRVPADALWADPVRQVRAGSLPASPEALLEIQVGAGTAGVVELRDVAEVVDGPGPARSQALHWQRGADREAPAVSLAITTVPHYNVSDVTDRAMALIESAQGTLIPAGIDLRVAYDAGRAATETVRSVLRNFATAMAVVVVIILLGLGWRAALGVFILIPASMAIVPFAYWLTDFTLNPISIAAMILAIGLIADDNVIIMENIGRYFRDAGERSRELTVKAVDEVGNPTILAVVLIIITLLPTAFISGEMGQYTRVIPVGASWALLFSLTVALTATPYLAFRLLRAGSSGQRDPADGAPGEGAPGEGAGQSQPERPAGRLASAYRALLEPLFDHAWLRWSFYGVLVLLLAGSAGLVVTRVVQLTLVPFLDREAFVVELELPPGSTLERTLEASAALGRTLRAFPEVEAYTTFAGVDGPMLMPRSGPPDIGVGASHRAALYVQLPPEHERERLSYELDRELFDLLGPTLEPFAGLAWIRRIPSGPAADNAVQAEIFGPAADARFALADRVAQALDAHDAAGNLERFPAALGPETRIRVAPQRSAARGVPPARAVAALQTALAGREVTALDLPGERHPVPVVVELRDAERAGLDDLASLYVRSLDGSMVPLADVVEISEGRWQANRYRKNQLPVVYVAAEVHRDRSQPLSVQRDVVAALAREEEGMPPVNWFGVPRSDVETTLFWGGEWEMTQQVYRDMGLAGLAVLLVIYALLAGWFNSYLLPVIIMAPIPLVFIGVIPAHGLMGLDIAGFGVLGVIALAGIVVRNAVLLVDFTQSRVKDGMAMRDALIAAATLRTRPILLTAGTVMFGSGALVFEPALKPLGLTLASGVLVATLLTLLLIPTLYMHCLGPRESQQQRSADRHG
ncbi:efflux RND transporter permease subunit [Thioalkalivibrio sp. XN279]|uniref:efflux RND transporter permease subunit n=1 Tax=Thioalkalivibrio sp. XN279 TaxID=2714953 RepID=UPI00140DC073|nr:efflux RND transporter permease subunit [Thioalkalivibrio sp. XN279]NHA14411.1 efflux RND transporter permease subunit [Thioalkalivibrio sp. XN279]